MAPATAPPEGSSTCPVKFAESCAAAPAAHTSNSATNAIQRTLPRAAPMFRALGFGAPHTRRRHSWDTAADTIHTHHEISSRKLLPPTATRVLRPTKIYEFIRKIQIGCVIRYAQPPRRTRTNVARHGTTRRRPECGTNDCVAAVGGVTSCLISARQCSQASVARPLRFQHRRAHPAIACLRRRL